MERELLISLVFSDRPLGNGSKLRQGRSRPDIRKHSFTDKVVICWNRFLRELVDVLVLSQFKKHLDEWLGSWTR